MGWECVASNDSQSEDSIDAFSQSGSSDSDDPQAPETHDVHGPISYSSTFCGNKNQDVIFSPGPLGITLDAETGEVCSVMEGQQAQQLGVKVGWHVLCVDGKRDFVQYLQAVC